MKTSSTLTPTSRGGAAIQESSFVCRARSPIRRQRAGAGGALGPLAWLGLAFALGAMSLSGWGGTATVPFTENFETPLGDYWSFEGSWGATTTLAHGGTTSLTDSPGATYANSTDTAAYLEVDLAGTTSPYLSFWHRYALESWADYGYVEVSNDGRQSWRRVFFVTGFGPNNWSNVRIHLFDFAGQQITIRFRLYTNESNYYDGWYVDDVEVKDEQAQFAVPWKADMDGTGAETNWFNSCWYLGQGSATSTGGKHWHFSLSPQSWSSYIGPTVDLVPAGTFDLSRMAKPQLTFRYGKNYPIRFEVWIRAGGAWTRVFYDDRWQDVGWTRVQLDLGQFATFTQVNLGFRVYKHTGDPAYGMDAYVDDIGLGDMAPNVYADVGPGSDPRTRALISWEQSDAPDFAYYAVCRATHANVTPADPMVAKITDRATLSFEDGPLPVFNASYYYRVLVWTGAGIVNPAYVEPMYRPRAKQVVSQFPWADGLESGTDYWTFEGTWGTTKSIQHAGTYCLTDSPGTAYKNNVNNSATFEADLTGLARPYLSFWQRYTLENGGDYGYVETSSDGGYNWSRAYAVTGTGGTAWSNIQIPLTGYAGQTVRIRFRLVTNGNVTYDGWYIDDVEIKSAAGTQAPPLVENADGANPGANWLASGWTLANGSATSSAGKQWACSLPGEPDVDYVWPWFILEPLRALDLTTAINPQLVFWWRKSHNGRLWVGVSGNGGLSWSGLADYNWWGDVGWQRVQLDLRSFAGQANVLVRFFASKVGDRSGWFEVGVDDVGLGDPAADVYSQVSPGPDPRSQVVISWDQSTAPDFAAYAIYRATHSGVTVNDTLVAWVTNRTTLAFTDTTLPTYSQTYYYRVFVQTPIGVPSPGFLELSYRPQPKQVASQFPLSEGFESGSDKWAFEGKWGLTTAVARTGAYSLTDSPGTSYDDNADNSATMDVDFSNLSRPYLSFWHRYTLEPGADYGYVEVSADGGYTWLRLYAITGFGGTSWSNVQLPLSDWGGQQVRIRFRLVTNGSNRYDGWYLDDLEIKDNAARGSLPLVENADGPDPWVNWRGSSWALVSGSATSSSGKSWNCSLPPEPNVNYVSPKFRLESVQKLDLTKASNPQLVFRWRKSNASWFAVGVSGNGGASWTTVFWRTDWGDAAWQRAQVDLRSFAGLSEVVVRFSVSKLGVDYGIDVGLDDIGVGDLAPDVYSEVVAGSDPRTQAMVSWEQSNAPDFAYYAICRATHPGVTIDDMIAKVSDRTQLTYEDDSSRVMGTIYYYRLLVVTTTGLSNQGYVEWAYQPGFKEVITRFPFADGLEGGTDYWVLEGTWGVTSAIAHQGSNSLTDSPGSTYADGANTSASLEASLTGLARPYLSFWHRAQFEDNGDYGYVEVSNDGGASWWRAFVVTGSTGADWVNARIDLSAYAGSLVRIRFRLVSNGSNRYDGWYIDDVEIADNTRALPYPFADNFDERSSAANWMASSWTLAPGSANSPSGFSYHAAVFGERDINYYHPYVPLTLAGTLDLTAAINPQLTFRWLGYPWHRTGYWGEHIGYNYLYVEGSANGGQSWQRILIRNQEDAAAGWTREQVDLRPFAGSRSISIRFLLAKEQPADSPVSLGIDNVLIREQATHQILVTQGPDGNPNPVNLMGQVQCNLVAADSDGSQLTYQWTCSGGTFQDTGTAASQLGNPVWLPAQTGAYNIQVTMTTTGDEVISRQEGFTVEVTEFIQQVATPILSPPSGSTVPLTATIRTDTPGATIYYTVDGRNPTAESPIYIGPLILKVATTLKAMAVKNGMLDSETATATYATAPTYHAADYRAEFWVIDGSEVNRVLSYWRAGGYHNDPAGADGFAPGAGPNTGIRHSADYEEPFWALDGSEANRVLSYWRAGGYHRDAAGADGFAPGKPTGLHSVGTVPFPQVAVNQQVLAQYVPGQELRVTGTFAYEGKLLSLLWRPHLPAGWKLKAVSGDGAPEFNGREILWTGDLPSSPVQVEYALEVPAAEHGPKLLGAEAEWQPAGRANPVRTAATPVQVTDGAVGSLCRFVDVKCKPDGTVELRLQAEANRAYEILVSCDLQTWVRLTVVGSNTGELLIQDTDATGQPSRFYQARSVR